MAENTVALQFDLNADKANMSLGELENGYDELLKAIKKTDRGTEDGKKAFKELSTQLAATGKEVKNIELSFEALDNEQVASELGSVAGAAGDVAASFVLMSGGNKTLEEMAAGIEKAMAISMGLKGAIEGVSSGMKLYNNLIKTGTLQTKLFSIGQKIAAVATRVLNAVMNANPIMLIVTGLTLAAGALALYSRKVSETSREQEILNDLQKESALSTAEERAELEKLIAIAEDETQSKEKRREAIQKMNEISPEYLGNITLETLGTEEATAAIDGYIASLERKAMATALNDKLVEASKALIEAEAQTQEDLAEATGVFSTAVAGLTQNKNVLNETRQESIDKAQLEIDAVLNLIKAQEKEVDTIHTLKEKKEEDLAKDKEKEANRKKNRADKKRDQSEDVELEIIKRDNDLTIQMEDLDRDKIHIEGLISNKQLLQDYSAQWHADEMERIAAEKATRLEAIQVNLGATIGLVNSLGSLSDAKFASDMRKAGADEKMQEVARKKQFEREKKLQMAMAVLNGAQALVSIFAQYPKFDGGFAMTAALVASGITTAASIAKIAGSKYEGGGGGGGGSFSPTLPTAASGASEGSGGAQIDPVTNQSTVLGDNKVFVTETDITSTQNNVNVIEESATF